uniref:ShKT domain-containing protein n=1 Tax=Acrobeloides nanus TaxID=290746 RepID=A0A914E8B6_9BILA
MFRVILISSLLAMVLAGLLNVVLPVTNKLPDFSDITDDVTDVVKSRMNGLVSKGVGRNVKELIGIQKKLKIINKIAAEQVKRANAKHGNPSAHPVVFEESVDHLGMKNKDEVLDSLLFQGDMFLPEDQLDRMIEDAANELGWGHDVLTKLGVATRSKRQALINPPNDYRWELPISYYYDDSICMLVQIEKPKSIAFVLSSLIPGMTAKDTLYDSTMGTNLGPQFGDIVLINNHYQCMCQNATVTCANGGYPNPNGCATCICTGGYGGTTCSDRDPGTENGGATLQATASDSCQTLKTCLGNDDNITNVYNQKSWFIIQAPAGKQVQLIFTKAGSTPGMPFTKTYGCKFQGVEVKIRSGEYNRTGFIFCGDNPVLVSNTTNIIPFTSDNNLAILQIYTMKNMFNLEVKYRYVDSTTDPTTYPVSCQPCQDNNTTCASLVQSCNDPQIASDCPATCGTCPT